MRTILSLSIIFMFFSINVFAEEKKEKELILTLNPENKYDLNEKYEEVEEYKEKRKKRDSNISIDTDINKETKTVDKVKIDMGAEF